MQLLEDMLLAVNAGSSSIKFAFFLIDADNTRLSSGYIENIGGEKTRLHFVDENNTDPLSLKLPQSHFEGCVDFLIQWLKARPEMKAVRGIGHRIVSGFNRDAPALITADLLGELDHTIKYDPEHMPGTLAIIRRLGHDFPGIEQVACFDSAFHASMPPVAKMIPLPRTYFEKGIQRFGYHGLSYGYLMQELIRLDGKGSSDERVILLHLGNGSSLAAVHFGKSQDTSMGFSPASGIPMSTRCGDIDPGVVCYLMQENNITPDQFSHLVNHESGLLGISGSSGNMEELLTRYSADPRAGEAVDHFCYQVRKCIGAFAAVLGGVDSMVFSGGIGANSPVIREKVCQGLQFLGIQLDFTRNMVNEQIISEHSAPVKIRVMKTNEEIMIARLTTDVMTFKTIPV